MDAAKEVDTKINNRAKAKDILFIIKAPLIEFYTARTCS